MFWVALYWLGMMIGNSKNLDATILYGLALTVVYPDTDLAYPVVVAYFISLIYKSFRS